LKQVTTYRFGQSSGLTQPQLVLDLPQPSQCPLPVSA